MVPRITMQATNDSECFDAWKTCVCTHIIIKASLSNEKEHVIPVIPHSPTWKSRISSGTALALPFCLSVWHGLNTVSTLFCIPERWQWNLTHPMQEGHSGWFQGEPPEDIELLIKRICFGILASVSAFYTSVPWRSKLSHSRSDILLGDRVEAFSRFMFTITGSSSDERSSSGLAMEDEDVSTKGLLWWFAIILLSSSLFPWFLPGLGTL